VERIDLDLCLQAISASDLRRRLSRRPARRQLPISEYPR
jgi:hypothetical protein